MRACALGARGMVGLVTHAAGAAWALVSAIRRAVALACHPNPTGGYWE